MQTLSLFADSEPKSDAAVVVAHSVASGSGVCTIKRGATVAKAGIEYRVAEVKKSGVVKLNNLSGGFAMFSHLNSVQPCEVKKGRRAVHADAAARVAAHRAKQARLDYTDEPAIALTIEEIARALDQSKQDVLRSLVRFALTNRNWKQSGLYGRKGA